jgi:uncharacterized membrane protein HdeD (DUF308 family)
VTVDGAVTVRLERRPRDRRSLMRSGVITAAVGLALLLGLLTLGVGPRLIAGLIPLFVGLAELVFALLEPEP